MNLPVMTGLFHQSKPMLALALALALTRLPSARGQLGNIRTLQPTNVPTTSHPTASPSANPTKEPTANPTALPSTGPSTAPTDCVPCAARFPSDDNETECAEALTAGNPALICQGAGFQTGCARSCCFATTPSCSPTASPTPAPTTAPTTSPSARPTEAPSLAPTQDFDACAAVPCSVHSLGCTDIHGGAEDVTGRICDHCGSGFLGSGDVCFAKPVLSLIQPVIQPGATDGLLPFEATAIVRLELDFAAASQNGFADHLLFEIATTGGVIPPDASSLTVSVLDGQPRHIAVESTVIPSEGSSQVMASLDRLEFVTATVELMFAVVGGSFNNNQHHQVWVTSTGNLNLTSSNTDSTNSSDGSGDEPSSTPLGRYFVTPPINFDVGNPTLSHNWTMDDVSAAVVPGDVLTGTITVSNGDATDDLDAHDLVLSLGMPSQLLGASVASVSGAGIDVNWQITANGDADRLEITAVALPKGAQIVAVLSFEVLNEASFGSVIGWAAEDGLLLEAYDGVPGSTLLGYSGVAGSDAVPVPVGGGYQHLATVAVPRIASYSLVSPVSSDADAGATPITVHMPITTVAAITVPRGSGDVFVDVLLPVANSSGTSLVECPSILVISTDTSTINDDLLRVEEVMDNRGELFKLRATFPSLANLGNGHGETTVEIQIDMPVRDHAEASTGTIITMPFDRAISISVAGEAQTSQVTSTATLDAMFEVAEAAIEVALGSSARLRFDARDTITFNATLSHSVNISTAGAHNIVLTLVVPDGLWLVPDSIGCFLSSGTDGLYDLDSGVGSGSACTVDTSLTVPTVSIAELAINATVTVRWAAIVDDYVEANFRPSFSVVGDFDTLAGTRESGGGQPRRRRAGCSISGRVLPIGPVSAQVDSNAAVPLMNVTILDSTLPLERQNQHFLVPGEVLTLMVLTRIPEVSGDYTIEISVAPMRILSADLIHTVGVENGDLLLHMYSDDWDETSRTFHLDGVNRVEGTTTADDTTYGEIGITIQVVLEEDYAEASAMSRAVGSIVAVATTIGYGLESDSTYALAIQEPVLTINHTWQSNASRIVEAADAFDHEVVVRHSQVSRTPNLAYNLVVTIYFDAIYNVNPESVRGCLYESSSGIADFSDVGDCDLVNRYPPVTTPPLIGNAPPGTTISFEVPALVSSDFTFHVIAQSVVLQEAISGTSQAIESVVSYTSIPRLEDVRGRQYHATHSFETAVKGPAIEIAAFTLGLDRIMGWIRIGEIFVIRTAVIFAEGGTTAVELELELPQGLQFVSSTITAVEPSFDRGVPVRGAGVTLDSPLLTFNRTVGEPVDRGHTEGDGLRSELEVVLDCRFEVVGGNSVNEVTRVRYSAPEVRNRASVPGLDDTVLIDTVVVVRDLEEITGIAPQTTLETSGVLNFGELGQTVLNANTVTLSEPELALQITHTAVATVDGDDVVDYTLTISHTATSTAAMFECVTEVSLPEHLVTHYARVSASTVTPCNVTNVTATGFLVECPEIADSEEAVVVIDFKARVLGTIAPNVSAYVSASSMYTTMPHDSVSLGSYTGRTKFFNTSSPSVTTAAPGITIEPIETSRDDTLDWWLGIAELVTYRIALVLPEVTTNLSVTVDLPTGLNCRALTATLGSSLLTSFNASGDQLNCSAQSSSSPTFDFGVVENVPDNSITGSDNTITLDLLYQLGDVPNVTNGRSLMVLARYTCHDGGSTAQQEDTDSQVVVAEPLLALSAVATTAGPYDADNHLNFTITLGYDAHSHATAYDMSVGVVLGLGVDEIVGVHLVEGSVDFTLDITTDLRTLNWTTPELESGSFFGVIVTSRVQQHVYPGMTLDVFAETAFDSHPAPTYHESQLSSTTFEGRSYEMETASSVVTVAQLSVDVARSGSSSLTATVGELIELRVALRLPESTMSDTAVTLNLTGTEQHRMVELLSTEVVYIGETIQCTDADALFVFSAGVADWNSSARLDLGDCINVADNLGDGNDTILIDVVAVLKDVVAVAGGGTFVIRSELSHTVPLLGAVVAANDSIAMSVVEPKMNIAVITEPARDNIDAADLVNFTLRVEHTGASRHTTSTANDITITAVMTPELEFVEDTTDWPVLLGANSTVRHSLTEDGNGTISVYIASHSFEPTSVYYISFVGKLKSGVPANAFNVRCTASMSWNSLPVAVRNGTGQVGRTGVHGHNGGVISVAGLSIDSTITSTSLNATANDTIGIGEVALVAATIMQPEVNSTLLVTAELDDRDGFVITSYQLQIGSNIQGCLEGSASSVSADNRTLSLVLDGTCSNVATRNASTPLDNTTDAIVLTLTILAPNVTTLVQGVSSTVTFSAAVTFGAITDDIRSSKTLVVVEPAFDMEPRMPATGHHYSPGEVVFLDLLVNVSTFGYDVNITVALPPLFNLRNRTFGGLGLSGAPHDGRTQISPDTDTYLDSTNELRLFYKELLATDAVVIRMAVELDPSASPGLPLDVDVALVHASSHVGAPDVRRGAMARSFPTLYVTHLTCTFADTSSESASTGTDLIMGESVTYTADCLVRGKGSLLVTAVLMRDDGTSLGCYESANVDSIGSNVYLSGSNVNLSWTEEAIVSSRQVVLPINVINIATDPATPEPIGDGVRIELRLRGVDANATECSADAALPPIRYRGAVANTGIDIGFGGHATSVPDVLRAVAPLLELVHFNCSRISVEGGDVISYIATIVAASTNFTSDALDVMINTSSPYIDRLAITSDSHALSSVTVGTSRNHLVDAVAGAGISASVIRISQGDTLDLAWSGIVSDFAPHGQPLSEEIVVSFRTVSDDSVFRYLAFDDPAIISTAIHEIAVNGKVLSGETVLQDSEVPLFGIGEQMIFRITFALPSGRSSELGLLVSFDDSLLIPPAADIGLDTNFSGGHTTAYRESSDGRSSVEVQLGTVQETATYYVDVPFVVANVTDYNLMNYVTVSLIRNGNPVSDVGFDILFRVSEPSLVTYSITYTSVSNVDATTVVAGDIVKVSYIICNQLHRDDEANSPSTIAYSVQPNVISSVPLQSETMTCGCIECSSQVDWRASTCNSVNKLIPSGCLIFDYTVKLSATMELGPAVHLRVPIAYLPAPSWEGVYNSVVGSISLPSTPVSINTDDGGQTELVIGEMAVVTFTLLFPDGIIDNAVLEVDLGTAFVFPEFDDDSVVDMASGARVRRQDDNSSIVLSANGTSTPVYDINGPVTVTSLLRASNRKLTLNVTVAAAVGNQASPANAFMSLRFATLVIGDAATTASSIDLSLATEAAPLGDGRLSVSVVRPMLAPMVGTLSREDDGALIYAGTAAHDGASTLRATAVSYSLAPQMADSSLPFPVHNLTVTDDVGNGTLTLPVGSTAFLGIKLLLLAPASLGGGDVVCLSVQLAYNGPKPSALFLAAMTRIGVPETRLTDAPAETCLVIGDDNDAATAESSAMAAGSVAGIIVGILLVGGLVALFVVIKLRGRVVHEKEEAETADLSKAEELVRPEPEPVYLEPDLGGVLDTYINKQQPLCALIETGNEAWIRFRRAIGFDHGYYGNKLNRLEVEQLEDVYAVLPLPVLSREHLLKLHVLADDFIGQKMPVSDEAGVICDVQLQERTLDDVVLFMLESMPDVLVERALDVIASMVMAHRAKSTPTYDTGAAALDGESAYSSVAEALYAIVKDTNDEDLYETIDWATTMLDQYDPKNNAFLSVQSNGERRLYDNAAMRLAINDNGLGDDMAVAIYPTADSSESNRHSKLVGDRVYDMGGSMKSAGFQADDATYSLAASDVPVAGDDIYDMLSFDGDGRPSLPQFDVYGSASAVESAVDVYGSASALESGIGSASGNAYDLGGNTGATYALGGAGGVVVAGTNGQPMDATYDLGGTEGATEATYDLGGTEGATEATYDLGSTEGVTEATYDLGGTGGGDTIYDLGKTEGATEAIYDLGGQTSELGEPSGIPYRSPSEAVSFNMPGDVDADDNDGIIVPTLYSAAGNPDPAATSYLDSRKASILSFSEMNRLMTTHIDGTECPSPCVSRSSNNARPQLVLEADSTEDMDTGDVDGGYIEQEGLAPPSRVVSLLGVGNDFDADDGHVDDDKLMSALLAVTPKGQVKRKASLL